MADVLSKTDCLTNLLDTINKFDGTPEEKLQKLSKYEVKKEKFLNIQVKPDVIDGHKVYILNYDQTKSPSFHPLVIPCRSLVLSYDFKKEEFYPVSRSYDRFPDCFEDKFIAEQILNILPERKNTKFHRVFEKKDGSIIMIFWHSLSGKWVLMTRATLGTGTIGRTNVTFRESFEKQLGHFIEKFDELLNNKEDNKQFTFIFETYIPDGNHVVTRYPSPFICLLDARKLAGEYASEKFLDDCANALKVERPEVLLRNATMTDVKKYLEKKREIHPLFEGAVAHYDLPNGNRIMFKIKDSWYYIFHNNMYQSRGPKLTNPSVTIRLYVTNALDAEKKAQKTTDEEEKTINTIIEAYTKLKSEYEDLGNKAFEVKNQKDVAKLLGDHPLKNAIFIAKRNSKTSETFLEQLKTLWMQHLDKVIDTIEKFLEVETITEEVKNLDLQ
jgi:hypothetical protein